MIDQKYARVTMNYKTIEVEVSEHGVARLTLNRPQGTNARTARMDDEARAAVAGVVADPATGSSSWAARVTHSAQVATSSTSRASAAASMPTASPRRASSRCGCENAIRCPSQW